MVNAQVIAAGFYVPEEILDNNFFVNSSSNPYLVYIGQDEKQNPVFKQERVYITEQKILDSTGGIKERRKIAHGQTVVDLIEKAFINADFPADKLEGIIVGTVSDETRYPSVACRTHGRIKANNVRYTEDIGAACSGFTHALDHARLKIQEEGGYYAVAGAEALTLMVDYHEINCNLFGDGAGVVILGPTQDKERGILATEFRSDVSGIDFIYRDKLGLLRMPQGPKVFAKATRGMVEIAHSIKEKAGISKDEVKMYFPHQANGRIVDYVGGKIDPQNTGKVYRNIERYGNMSAATVPVAFAEAWQNKLIKEGDAVVLLDVGSGLVFGSALIRI
mgnify:CR=1 FL=1